MPFRFLRLCGFCACVALSATGVACAESVNDAPIIDSVETPLAVTAQNGTYTIPVTVLFHDNDGEAITRLRYRLPPNIDGVIDVPAPNPTLESAQLTIVIAAADVDKPTTLTGYSDDDREHKNDEARREHERGSGDRGTNGPKRGRTRALHLTIVDGRGAESLPQSSTLTLY